MKKISVLLVFLTLLCVLASCDTSSVTPTDTTDGTGSDGSASVWQGEGVEITDSYIKTTEAFETYTVYCTDEQFPERFVFDAAMSLSKYSFATFAIEAKFDEAGEITSGYTATLDCRGGLFYVSSYYDGLATRLSESSFTLDSDGEYYFAMNRNRNTFEVSVFKDSEKKEYLAYSSLLAREFKGETTAFLISGDVILSDITYAPYQKDETIKYYQNPIHEVMADPSIYYEDGVYYLFSTGDFFECYTTTDLVNYTPVGKVADTKDLFGSSYFGGAVIHKFEDTYYLFYTTHPDQSKTNLVTCVATSDNVLGPYTQPKQTMLHETLCTKKSAGSFVMSAPDGKTYLYWYNTETGYGNNIHGAEITISDGVVTLKEETERRLLVATEDWEKKEENDVRGSIVERPTVYYHNGYYYLFYAGSHWKTSYGEGYAVSKDPLGEFVKYENNPILNSTASLNGVGCTIMVPSPDGKELFVLYHCHYNTTTPYPRQLCLDRIVFVDNGDDADIAFIVGPTATPQPYPSGTQ